VCRIEILEAEIEMESGAKVEGEAGEIEIEERGGREEIEEAGEEEEGEADKMVVKEEVVEIEEIGEIVTKMAKDKKKCMLIKLQEKLHVINNKCKNKFYKKKHVFLIIK